MLVCGYNTEINPIELEMLTWMRNFYKHHIAHYYISIRIERFFLISLYLNLSNLSGFHWRFKSKVFFQIEKVNFTVVYIILDELFFTTC